MSRTAPDLVVERLVLEGVDLTPERAERLARLVEEELRPIVAGGRLSVAGGAGVTDARSVSLTEPVDLRALARGLARRIASEVMEAGGGRV